MVQAINASALRTLGITARVNDARNGILLTDTTGGSTSHLVVADGDSTQTATKLHIVANTDATSVNSGDLHLQVVSQQTKLADLNGGGGVARGTLTIYNSTGQSAHVNLAQGDIQTVGDLIRAINLLGLNVEAGINSTGDGIALTDTAGGSGTLHVQDSSSTAVADLHLDRSAVHTTVGGRPAQVLDGSTTETIQLAAGDSLADLQSKIAAAGSGSLGAGSSRTAPPGPIAWRFPASVRGTPDGW